MKKITILTCALVMLMTLNACVSTKITEHNGDFESTTEILSIKTFDYETSTECAKKVKETLLATANTSFDATNSNRRNNIELAGNMINGTVLEAGKSFSFNEVVGERTLDRGFLSAGVFVNVGGKTVTRNGVGGGICQLSSTIYMTVLDTSMEVLERNEHSKRVAYTTRDKEAMINWGTSDLKFKNTYDFPIRIEILFEIQDNVEIVKCNIYSINDN